MSDGESPKSYEAVQLPDIPEAEMEWIGEEMASFGAALAGWEGDEIDEALKEAWRRGFRHATRLLCMRRRPGMLADELFFGPDYRFELDDAHTGQQSAEFLSDTQPKAANEQP